MNEAKKKKKKLDVLQISASYDPPLQGGVSSHVATLSNALRRLTKSPSSRRLVCFVYVWTGMKYDYPFTRYLKVRCLPRKESDPQPFSTPSSAPLADAIQHPLTDFRDESPDVIHAHDFESAYIGMMLKRAFDVPLIVTVHKTPKEIDPSAYKYYAKDCFMSYLFSCDSVDCYVAPSKCYQERLIANGIPKEKIERIYHGVPILDLADRKLDDAVFGRFSLTNNDRFILCPARLDRHKGIETLIEAAEEIVKYPQWRSIKFVVAGGGGSGDQEKKYAEGLRAMVGQRSLKESVLLAPPGAGDCNPAEMKALYKRAVACVLPSQREGLGQSILEAFVYGSPVVASNTGGIPELITADKNGLLFDRGEPDKLAAKLKVVLTGGRKVKDMVANAKATVEEKYSAHRMAQHYLDLYLRITGNSLQ